MWAEEGQLPPDQEGVGLDWKGVELRADTEGLRTLGGAVVLHWVEGVDNWESMGWGRGSPVRCRLTQVSPRTAPPPPFPPQATLRTAPPSGKKKGLCLSEGLEKG